jgi:competence protein ComEC
MNLKRLEEFAARSTPYICGEFLIGIIGFYCVSRLGISIVLLGLIMGLAIGVYCVREAQWRLVAVILLLFAGYAGYATALRYEVIHSAYDIVYDVRTELRGVVVDQPDRRYDKQYVTVQPDTEIYRIRIKLPLDTTVAVGDRVSVVGILHKPEAFETDTGVVFDYPRYLAVDTIIAEIKKPESFVRIGVVQQYRVYRALSLYRMELQALIERFVPVDALGLAVGTTLGSAEYIAPEMIDQYRITGLSHIIVLSGFNISIIAVGVSWIIMRLGVGRTATVMVSIVFVWLFIALVGFGASSVRAGLMSSIVLMFSGLLDRQASGLKSLLYALVVFSVVNPRALVDDVGFQLSVLATFGLLVVLPVIQRSLYTATSQNSVVRIAEEIYCATCAVAVTTLPLLYLKMGSVAALGLVSNVLVVWIVPVIMAGVLCVVLVFWAPSVALGVGALVGVMVAYVHVVTHVVARVSPLNATTSMIYMLVSVAVIYWLLSLVGGVRGRDRSIR